MIHFKDVPFGNLHSFGKGIYNTLHKPGVFEKNPSLKSILKLSAQQFTAGESRDSSFNHSVYQSDVLEQ